MDKVGGILYYRTAAFRWQDSNHSQHIPNVERFLQIHDCPPELATLVSAKGTYSVLCLQLTDDPNRGIFQQELIIEFPTKETALAWCVTLGLEDVVCDHQL